MGAVRAPSRLVCSLIPLLVATQAAIAAAGDATIRVSRVPDGGLYPQAAVDSRGRLHLLYVKGDPRGADAYYVRSDDGGATFTTPLRVNSQPKSVIIAGTVRGPHLAVGREGRVHAAWMGSSVAEPRIGKLAPMLYTRLAGDGSSFEPQRNVVTSHPGLDGGGSIAADQDGNVYVAWHAPEDHDKKEGEEGRHVWIARSTDDGQTFRPERRANKDATGVCACCGIRIFAAEKGRVLIAYRTAKAVVNRDMALLVSNDQADTFAAAASDPWKVGQCVMSTSSFAASPSGSVVTAWETERQIRLGRLDGGSKASLALESAPGEGKNRKHPSIAVSKAGETLLVWTEGTGWEKGGSIAWQLYGKDAKPVAGQGGRAPGLPVWGVPAAVSLADGSFRVIY